MQLGYVLAIFLLTLMPLRIFSQSDSLFPHNRKVPGDCNIARVPCHKYCSICGRLRNLSKCFVPYVKVGYKNITWESLGESPLGKFVSIHVARHQSTVVQGEQSNPLDGLVVCENIGNPLLMRIKG